MKHYIPLLIAAAFVLVPAQTVLAQNGRPDTAVQREQAQVRAQEAREQAQTRADEARQTAEARVDQIKQEVEERKTTIKQEVCERRQERLQTVMPRLATGATSVKNSLDTVYERVQGFYNDGQLTVSNYDELNGNVAAAKADAEVALAAVESYQFELDCDNPNVGEQLDGFRTLVSDTRDSLKNYREQLVALISSMKAAAAEEAESNPDDTNATEESETTEVEEGDENEQE